VDTLSHEKGVGKIQVRLCVHEKTNHLRLAFGGVCNLSPTEKVNPLLKLLGYRALTPYG
jgi:hypothetical protein